MAAARSQASKPAEGLVINVRPTSNGANPDIYPRQPAGWLDLLAAGVNGSEVELLVGKRARPDVEKGTPIVILCAGLIRCRLRARRLANGIYGFMVVVAGADVVDAVPITVSRDDLLVRWENAFGRPPPSPVTFMGVRDAWWREDDEKPFPGWVSAGLPAEVAEVAKGLVRSFPPKTAAAPPGSPKAGSPVAPTATPAASSQTPAKPALVVHAPQAEAPAPKAPPAAPKPPPGQGSLF